METTFKKFLFFVSVLLLTASLASAQIPSGIGWHDLGANTVLDNVCACTHGFPDVCYTEGCSAITADWSGGVMDTTRDRLIIWGGGHAGYKGNEVYALNLSTSTLTRLNNPTLPVANGCTVGSPPQPNSLHTYDGIVYLPMQDRILQNGGFSPNGTGCFDTWEFNPNTNSWTNRNATPTPNYSTPVGRMTYDPNTGYVFLMTDYYLYLYNYSANTYTKCTDENLNQVKYPGTSLIDVKNKKFLIVTSSNVYWWDIDPAANKCDGVHTNACVKNTMDITMSIGSSYFPGLAWDSKHQKVVAWDGGNNIYVLNPDYANNKGTWTTYTFSGGPTALGNGTYKRFSYSPTSDVFVVYNATNRDAFALRLDLSSNDTISPTIPSNLSATAISSSQINLSWTASTDNVGVSGYKIYRNGSQIATTQSTSYQDTGLSPSTTYTYTVSAYDTAGNNSGQSSSASATTQGSPPPVTSNSKFPGIPGCTNAYYIDADCDGYGPGSPSGPDADDSDVSVNTAASALAKYGTIANYLTARGYPNQSVYYVAANGNDSTGAKNDSARPYKKWSTVEALLHAGDVVMFRGSTYYGNAGTTVGEYGIYTTKQGASGNPIVIMNYPGEKAIIDTSAQCIGIGGSGHSSHGGKYLIFDGLVCANTRNWGSGTGFEADFVDHCTFRNIEEYGYVGSFWGTYDTQDLTLEYSVIRNNSEHGIYLGTTGYPSANFNISNNLIHHNGYHGAKHNGRLSNSTFQKNVIHSNYASGLDFENGLTNSLIDRNYIFNNENQGVMIYNYPSGYYTLNPYSQTGNTISNNVIWVGKYAPSNCSDGGTTNNFYAIRFTNDIRQASWQANHSYSFGGDGLPENYMPVVYPSTPNGYWYKLMNDPGPCTSGSSEPSWVASDASTTNDGACQWVAFPGPSTMDNNVISNNSLVTNDGPVIYFGQNDYWDTTTISGNTIYKTGSSTTILKIVSTTYNWSGFQSKNPSHFTSNTNADPGFTAASVNYCLTPENFDFTTGGDTSRPAPPTGLRVLSQ